ncbi:zinc-ribbon domain containing protein [Phormidium sp. FACHB-592]|uniref:Zinc-ribbon domain-containing protein n=1 Tax=Stenomitos frigidus AS-A4 TaxID=2933935 RepID=A0ABV0KL58_9CYAN|nr:zinc-ribbon domain containing protein [Phormidium sp. FACHB-592]MBD2073225.1 zinc-ribbon domain containing protein [Phormidium sp. FACHB-592]
MKSGKQRRQEIKARRKKAAAQTVAQQVAEQAKLEVALGGVLVDGAALAPDNSYGAPDFVQRGYYLDRPFVCQDCGVRAIWTASQQKWWYEVAKGGVWTTAIRCRPCRVQERERRQTARRLHLEGLARKKGIMPNPESDCQE